MQILVRLSFLGILVCSLPLDKVLCSMAISSPHTIRWYCSGSPFLSTTMSHCRHSFSCYGDATYIWKYCYVKMTSKKARRKRKIYYCSWILYVVKASDNVLFVVLCSWSKAKGRIGSAGDNTFKKFNHFFGVFDLHHLLITKSGFSKIN